VAVITTQDNVRLSLCSPADALRNLLSARAMACGRLNVGRRDVCDADNRRSVSVSDMRFFVLMLFASNAIAAEAAISQPVFIPSPGISSAGPFVAESDSGFLVAWDERSPGAITTESAVVKVRTFREDGTARQPGEVFVAEGFGAHPTWTGNEYVVAYAKPQFVRPIGPRAIAAITRVSEESRVLGKELILAYGSSGVVLGLACDGQTCRALLSVDGRYISVVFDPAGGVLQTIDVSTNAKAVRTFAPFSEICGEAIGSIAINRLGSMVAWIDGYQVRSLFTQSGQLPDCSHGDVISVVAAPQSDASAAVDDQGLLLAWSERDRIFLGGEAVGDLYASSPRLSVAGAQTLFVRVEHGHLLASRLAARIAQQPLIDVADRVSHADDRVGPDQIGEPAISTDGREWLVAWATYDQQVRIACITANGDVMPPGGTAILPSSFKQREPSVAWDGSAFRVVWVEEAEEEGVRDVHITTRLVDRSGLPIGRESSFGVVHPQESAFSLSSVSLGCATDACLVVWMHGIESTFSGASVRSDGSHGIEKGLFASNLRDPAVVRPRDSGDFEVWHDKQWHVVSPDGDVISSTTWNANDIIVYDVIAGGAGPIILYARSVEDDQLGDSFRLFLLLPKRRAVR
jgi:hypothetical protein